ncbi:MAG: 16S rRNA (cytosine(967)-C(5))-methyltransferase RsmB, partial [Bacteroidetes bacterium]|nr:16S rRNA (cytosine(967)-C(5))-methyltransferase RsmB [Bacteroidota bacterium]
RGRGAPGSGRSDAGRPGKSTAPAREHRAERAREPRPEKMPMRVLAARELDAMAATDGYIGLQATTRTGNADLDRSVRDMVAGVIRWQRYLDFLIASFYKGDADTLETSMRTVLRIGLHGLLFSRQPDHAVLNETVEAARIHVREGAAGLTNGLLRTALRRRDDLPEPTGTTVERMAIRYSHPDWLVERWVEQLGEEATRKLLQHNNERPLYGLHLLGDAAAARAALRAADIAFEDAVHVPDMVRMHSLQAVIRGGWLEEGRAFVQDEGAALVAWFARPESGQRVLDLCAAPGGKTIQLALAVGSEGDVTACDLQENRLGLVQDNARRMGLNQISISARDARDPLPAWEGAFDLVLLDAPCSGLGVLSKRADMRWRRSTAEIEEMMVLQAELLDAAARCVKQDGLLVYSTCTTEPSENAGQIEAFLQRHPDFRRESAPLVFPVDRLTSDGDYLGLPHETGMDGAFAARLRRRA